MIKVGDKVKIKGNPHWYTMRIDGKIGTVVEVDLNDNTLACAVSDIDYHWPWWVPYWDVTLVEA